MAHRVRFLAAVDVRATAHVVVAYPAGWAGLIPNAQFDRLRPGTFEEIGHGLETRKDAGETGGHTGQGQGAARAGDPKGGRGRGGDAEAPCGG
jgi:hypothetical protein